MGPKYGIGKSLTILSEMEMKDSLQLRTIKTNIGKKNGVKDNNTYIGGIGRGSIGIGQELSKLRQQIFLVLEKLGNLRVNFRFSERLVALGHEALQ